MHKWPQLTATEKIARMRLAGTKGVGPISYQGLIREFESASEALVHIQTKGKTPPSEREIEAVLAKNRKAKIHTLIWGDRDYPARLAEIADAPPVLFCKGDPSVLNRPVIGIVGARNASAAGQRLTATIAAELASTNMIAIASGLARGIDTAAHKASLETGTIACVAGGLDVPYPMENSDLFDSIGKAGAVVSERPLGSQPQARHFPRRNRIIAGLSLGVIIIEAAQKSGSLITARYAADYGRDVFAVPGSPLDPRSSGGNGLIRDGAILTRSAQDILEAYPALADMAPASDQSAEPHNTSPSALSATDTKRSQAPKNNSSGADVPTKILGLLGHQAIEIDEIVRITGNDAAQVNRILMMLELEGKVTKHAGGRVSLSL